MSNQAASNRYAPPSAEVSDAPEETGELAGRGTRLVAAILDGLILCIFIYTPLLVGGGFAALTSAAVSGSTLRIWQAIGMSMLSTVGIVMLVGLLAFIGITIYLVNKNGQNIGKKMMGIKVVRSDGSKVGLGRIFWLRNVIGWIVAIIPLVGSLYGLIASLMIFSEPRRCIHDRIADTIVIKA